MHVAILKFIFYFNFFFLKINSEVLVFCVEKETTRVPIYKKCISFFSYLPILHSKGVDVSVKYILQNAELSKLMRIKLF